MPSSRRADILIVDDEPAIRRLLELSLREAGFSPVCADNGSTATRLLEQQSFDAIVSDIDMPEMNGIEFLRRVRERDLDVPVILVTGMPRVETAMNAVEYGAFRYVPKPFEMGELLEIVTYAVQIHQLARIKREALEALGRSREEAADRAGMEAAFERALPRLWPAYQPIVSCRHRKVVAYEALMRSDEPALPHPGALLHAAEQLGRVHDLGRTMRDLVARDMKTLAPDHSLFLNLHPSDLQDEALYDEASPLAAHASRGVLEITERASLPRGAETEERLQQLRDRGFRLAVDDLGAGYAGLSSFVQLRPDLVKIDMSLVRNVDRDPTRQRVIRSLIQLSRDMAIDVVVEGVETEAELRTVVAEGGDLVQGYHFGKPDRGFQPVPETAFKTLG